MPVDTVRDKFSQCSHRTIGLLRISYLLRRSSIIMTENKQLSKTEEKGMSVSLCNVKLSFNNSFTCMFISFVSCSFGIFGSVFMLCSTARRVFVWIYLYKNIVFESFNLEKLIFPMNLKGLMVLLLFHSL